MRIPFDLIAALLAVEAVRAQFERDLGAGIFGGIYEGSVSLSSTGEALLALAGYWLVVWLLAELSVRRTEWLTRWGAFPAGVARDGQPPSRHPIEVQASADVFVQIISVTLFVLFLWHHRWPLKTHFYPEWFGLADVVQNPRTMKFLRGSAVAGTFFDLGPYVVAMVLSWIPKRRLAEGRRGRPIRLREWLGFEARLTFLPLVAWMLLNVLFDALYLAGVDEKGSWAHEAVQAVNEGGVLAGAAVGLLFLAFIAFVAMPWLMVRLFHCQPLPDGPLKERLHALVTRSGVKVRAILAWGTAGTGFLNACVLGPWSRLRYVLISPSLSALLTPEETEAVIAHELGHARHGHLVLLVAVVVGLGSLSGLLSRQFAADDPLLEAVLFMVMILLCLRLLFGAFMRACEREADLASAELMGSPAPLAGALEKLACVAGNIHKVWHWHHGSIAERIHNLNEIGLDAERIARYHSFMRRLRMAFLLFAVLSVAAHIGIGWAEAAAAASGP